jgi:OST-HTH/LOTUS domain
VENLRFADDDQEAGGGVPGIKPERPKPATATQLKNDAALVSLLRNAVEAASDDDGWAPLAAVGNILTNQRPDFDSRNYGYGKLSDLINAATLFEIERRSPGDGKQALMYAREKRRASAIRKAAATRSTRNKSTGSTGSTSSRSTGARTAKAAS